MNVEFRVDEGGVENVPFEGTAVAFIISDPGETATTVEVMTWPRASFSPEGVAERLNKVVPRLVVLGFSC